MGDEQTHLAGMEPAIHEDVTRAAKAYRSARDARMAKTVVEVETRDALAVSMKDHGLSIYEDASANIRVEIEQGKVKVKVKSLESESEPETEGE